MIKICSYCGEVKKHYKGQRRCIDCLKDYSKQRYNKTLPEHRKSDKELTEYAIAYNRRFEEDNVSLLFEGFKRIGIL